jgi:hypothetical protein
MMATRRFKVIRAVIQINPRMEIELVDLLGWKKGNSFIIRSLLR